jgi:hypothetical protein
MHIARLDLNLLVVFDTIYAEASITRASRRLNLSRPAISSVKIFMPAGSKKPVYAPYREHVPSYVIPRWHVHRENAQRGYAPRLSGFLAPNSQLAPAPVRSGPTAPVAVEAVSCIA